MVDAALLPALKEALKQNEIGNASPYALSYAKFGQSGASFGIFQGDMNVDHDARTTMRSALQASGAAADVIQRIMDALSHPLPAGSPLTQADEGIANAALASAGGRQLVDQMDGRTLGIIGRELDSAIVAARGNHMAIEAAAQLAIGLWVNMTGTPTTLGRWLGGSAIGGLAPPVGPVVTRLDVGNYLRNTNFFTMHPRNLVHFNASVDAGARLIPPGHVAALDGNAVALAAGGPPAPPAAASFWLYAQRTGRMFRMSGPVPTFLAKGYSGTGVAENDPDRQFERDHGPLPRGWYIFQAPAPFNRMLDCLRLDPDPGNAMGGRGGFLIHDGVFSGGPHGETSHGCICLIKAARLTMWDSNHHRLTVVRDDP